MVGDRKRGERMEYNERRRADKQPNHYCYRTAKMEIGSATEGKGYQGQTRSNAEMEV